MFCDQCGAQNRDDAQYCHSCGDDLFAQRVAVENATPATGATLHEVGSVIAGRYRIDKELGRGGMGVVYCAYDSELELQVALKVLHPRIADRSDAITHLREEALAAMRLTHPNIVRLHHLENTPQAKYLLMEYVQGQSLATMLGNGLAASLTERDVISIAKQVCDGLAAAHKAGVIHRDIKPSNILMTPEGRVKIVDFGIARAQDRRSGGTGKSRGAGTPTYMAPEQFTGGAVDGRTDIYALGATLYEVLATHPPFVGKDLKRQHLEDLPEPIPGVSAWLNEVVLKCLSKDPRDRWQSVEQLHKALEDETGASAGVSAQRAVDNEPEWRRVARERERRQRMRAEEKKAPAAQAVEELDEPIPSDPTPEPLRVLKPPSSGGTPAPRSPTPAVSGLPRINRPGSGAAVAAPVARTVGRRMDSTSPARRTGAPRLEEYPAGLRFRLPQGVLQFSVGAAVLSMIVTLTATWLINRYNLASGFELASRFVPQFLLGVVLGVFWGSAEGDTKNFTRVVIAGCVSGLAAGGFYAARGVTHNAAPGALLQVEVVRALVLGVVLGGTLGGVRHSVLAAVLGVLGGAVGGLAAAGAHFVILSEQVVGPSVFEATAAVGALAFLMTFGASLGAGVIRTPNPLRL